MVEVAKKTLSLANTQQSETLVVMGAKEVNGGQSSSTKDSEQISTSFSQYFGYVENLTIVGQNSSPNNEASNMGNVKSESSQHRSLYGSNLKFRGKVTISGKASNHELSITEKMAKTKVGREMVERQLNSKDGYSMLPVFAEGQEIPEGSTQLNLDKLSTGATNKLSNTLS